MNYVDFLSTLSNSIYLFKLTCFLTPLVLLLYYRPIFGGKIQTLICLLKSINFDQTLAIQEWYY